MICKPKYIIPNKKVLLLPSYSFHFSGPWNILPARIPKPLHHLLFPSLLPLFDPVAPPRQFLLFQLNLVKPVGNSGTLSPLKSTFIYSIQAEGRKLHLFPWSCDDSHTGQGGVHGFFEAERQKRGGILTTIQYALIYLNNLKNRYTLLRILEPPWERG